MNIVQLSKIKNFKEDPDNTFFKRVKHISAGVDTLDLKDNDKHAPFKQQIEKLHKHYGFEINDKKKKDNTYEIMTATYITPHCDDDFLENKDQEGLKEFQMLVPITMPEDGFDVYVYDKQTRKIEKVKTEIGVPFVFNYEQMHWTLPSKLNTAEKSLLQIVKEELDKFPTKEWNYFSKYNALLNRIDKIITKEKMNDTIRWNEPTNVQFLSSRVLANPDLKQLLKIDKELASKAQTTTKKKLKP